MSKDEMDELRYLLILSKMKQNAKQLPLINTPKKKIGSSLLNSLLRKDNDN